MNNLTPQRVQDPVNWFADILSMIKLTLYRQVTGKNLLSIFCCSLAIVDCTNVLAVVDVEQSETVNGMEVVFEPGEAIPIRHFDHEQAAINIDGRLDEAAWSGPPVLDRMNVL